jgi:hypothetical protein
MTRGAYNPPGSVVPPQSRQANSARVSSHDEWRVRWTRYGWERGRDRRKRAFVAQGGERGQPAFIDGAAKYIRPHSIGNDDDYLRSITWRASCRRTQL